MPSRPKRSTNILSWRSRRESKGNGNQSRLPDGRMESEASTHGCQMECLAAEAFKEGVAGLLSEPPNVSF